MRRSFVTTTFALSLALAPAALFAQAAPPAQQPPAQQPPAAAAAQPRRSPPRRRSGSRRPAGMLLVQIKPDQTAVFEEMMGKLKAGLAASRRTPRSRRRRPASRSTSPSEPFGANALYVILDRAGSGGRGVRALRADAEDDDARAAQGAGDGGDVEALRRRVCHRAQQAEPDAARSSRRRSTRARERGGSVPRPFLLVRSRSELQVDPRIEALRLRMERRPLQREDPVVEPQPQRADQRHLDPATDVDPDVRFRRRRRASPDRRRRRPCRRTASARSESASAPGR